MGMGMDIATLFQYERRESRNLHARQNIEDGLLPQGHGLLREHDLLDPFRTAVPFWGQSTQNLTDLSPKRDCSLNKRVKRARLAYRACLM